MIVSPILIIGCARSGTTLLYRLLSRVPEIWSIGYESKEVIEHYHSPAAKNWQSGVLTAEDLNNPSREYIYREFERQAAPGSYWNRVYGMAERLSGNSTWLALKQRGLSSTQGSRVVGKTPGQLLGAAQSMARLSALLRNKVGNDDERPMRLLEKTPENTLRLPFLQALFPDAKIIYIHRDSHDNIPSLMAGWKHPHLFPGYRVPIKMTIPGIERDRWAFTLIPGWKKLVDRPLAEVCAQQWVVCNEAVLDYLEQPDALPALRISLEELISEPANILGTIEDFLGLWRGSVRRPYQRVNALRSDDSPPLLDVAADEDLVETIIAPTRRRLGYD